MTEEKKANRGGSRLSRSEVTTIRLDPKLRYLAELAARKQRRTLSSFIEWSIEEALRQFPLKSGPDWLTSVLSEGERLWDVDEADRFAKLALNYPDLLNHEEQLLWTSIRECGYLWRGRYAPEWKWEVAEKSLLFDRLRKHWETFKAVVRGDAPPSELPTWVSNPSNDDWDDLPR